MSDQQVREIQLGGKQLVFLFMASVVVAVAIFLLGVSVGRGVRSASLEAAGPTDVAVADAPPAPLEMPAATETKPEDFRYHDQLQGSAPQPGAPPAAAPATSPATPQQPVVVEPPPKTTTAKSSADATAGTGTAAKEATGAGWFVQTDAFRSRDNADRRAAQLKAKGYAAVVDGGGGGALFRVRVGPFADRTEAARTADRLRREEGMQPSIQR